MTIMHDDQWHMFNLVNDSLQTFDDKLTINKYMLWCLSLRGYSCDDFSGTYTGQQRVPRCTSTFMDA